MNVNRQVALSVFATVVVMLLVRVMLERGNEVEPEILEIPRRHQESNPDVEKVIPRRAVHDPLTWKTREWYSTSGYKKVTDELRNSFNDEIPVVKIFKSRYDFIEKSIVNSDTVEVLSAPHPACTSQHNLQQKGSLSSFYPSEMPCSRYPFGQTRPIPWNKGAYQIVKNVVVYKDNIYTLEGEHSNRNLSIKWAGQFVTLRGFIYQITTDSFTLQPLPKELEKLVRDMPVREVGIYQPPTDFAALWHTVVEVALPLFHAILPYVVSGYNVSIVQQLAKERTTPSTAFQEIYKQKGLTWTCCALSPKTCMSTAYGELYKRIASGGLIFNSESDGPVLFKRMIFGTPTNCIPVWGIDSIFQAADGTIDEECSSLFWMWRRHWLNEYNARRMPKISLPIVMKEVSILWATRRNSESRRIDNEQEMISSINTLVTNPVVVTSFTGTLTDHFNTLQTATHLVSPHGAALINVIMLRVNSFVVMLDIHFPPFTGLSMEVPWVHHIHYNANLTCNPSHYKNQKKKGCKYIYRKPEGKHHIHNFPTSEHNNNIRVGESLVEAIKETIYGDWNDLSPLS